MEAEPMGNAVIMEESGEYSLTPRLQEFPIWDDPLETAPKRPIKLVHVSRSVRAKSHASLWFAFPDITTFAILIWFQDRER